MRKWDPDRAVHTQVAANIDMPGRVEPLTVFAKFVGTEIFAEMGRLLFSLLNAFAVSGYHIRLLDSFPHGGLEKYGRLACTLQGVTLTGKVPEDTSKTIYLFDVEDKTIGARAWRKKVEVRFDVFAPYWLRQPILMPYPVHPVHAGPDLPLRLQHARASTKKMRIFFSGDREGYVRNHISYPKPKLPRLEVVNAILQGMGEKALRVRGAADLDKLCAGGYVGKCLIMDQGEDCRIADADWLKTLATSDFFLCPPGFVMPMCHNAIETMAVGAIPIISYPEWFDPRLEHMKTCVEFKDKDDLLRTLNRLLELSEESIAQMRRHVIDYYETHLRPESFVRRIESDGRGKIIVLMITDANTSRNASKLGARSILIRGTSARSRGWLTGFHNRHVA